MKKLTLIYNSNSGILQGALDSIHKTFSPKTYNCNLCALTHGFFKEKKEWSEFLKKHDLEIEILHKNETKNKDLPQIKLNDEVILTSKEINELETLSQLIKKLNATARI